MEITNSNINFDDISTLSKNQKSSTDEKEFFKKVFVEQMVKELLETASYEKKENDLQKNIINDQLVESLSDQLMDFSDIEWEKIMNLSNSKK